jgi:CxxC motif-containing protein
MKELICIVCPKGCHLRVDEADNYAVQGNACPRGAEYGKAELTNPTRVVTSTVCVEGGSVRRCPVKTNRPIAKAKMFDVMACINALHVQAPVTVGQVLLADICNTGADLVATGDVQV